MPLLRRSFRLPTEILDQLKAQVSGANKSLFISVAVDFLIHSTQNLEIPSQGKVSDETTSVTIPPAQYRLWKAYAKHNASRKYRRSGSVNALVTAALYHALLQPAPSQPAKAAA